ncbi:MAG: AIM24 family protein [Lachnospiraceae bacterium]|nr:AIM24 family protein [Lachnospiraceae bacterium]
MVTQSNLLDNGNINVISELGNFKVLEHEKDLSVSSWNAVTEYFASRMNVRRRQVMIDLKGGSYTLQAGAMQWMSGNITMGSGVTGVGNFLGKVVASKVTGESAVKPVYQGEGTLMLEPTYRYILLIDVSKWGTIVLDDGLFLACDSSLQQKVVARSNLSSAVLGGEGLFNLSLTGNGIVACESSVPMEELIIVTLKDDVMKIDGNMAVAWSGSLDFTVEKAGKSLIGSAASGEGLVNVYRGTGKILLAPTSKNSIVNTPEQSDSQTSPSSSNSDKVLNALDKIGDVMDLFN